VKVRSVLTCEGDNHGICGKCYGRDLARGTSVNIGEAIGVMAAQSIGEPGTQLTMRTFHIGGAAQRGAERSSVEANIESTVEIRNKNIVKNSEGVPIVMGRNTEIILKDKKGAEKAAHRIPYGARLTIEDGAKVKPGQKMAEWDPYTHSGPDGKRRRRAFLRPRRGRFRHRTDGRSHRYFEQESHRLAFAAQGQRP
jgi:DNA-directed RNA polymerase subunit beta'